MPVKDGPEVGKSKTSLVIMAAGMGSRYGGIKQLEAVGASGETILEFGLYDAVRAGFSEVVFVIRKDIEADFRSLLLDRAKLPIPVKLVHQEIGHLPGAWNASAVTKTRTKPWGTAHAVWCAREVLDCPFAVINADDFYGRRTYSIMRDWLAACDEARSAWVMAGYRLSNTLSEQGPVSRGICDIGPDGLLRGIEEHKKLQGEPTGSGRVGSLQEDGSTVSFSPDTTVSMNFFGFTPTVLDEIDRQLREFLETQGAEPKAECYLPTVVNKALGEKHARMRVLDTPEAWFGVTYREDRPLVMERIRALIAQGAYPGSLWESA
ncbi:MAG TPA: nucleotidyltransferase [Treponema sp.]|nr:MAG: hypothetical protein A2001_12480 [Treponema sp. GWC1_61_84]OHE71201.1 MAG: hypothetical protein A2413_05505 [Treponema sp. RIFOXYC1_FULL_61_9]HCM27037.1 nucleotidyltransferase [Treponema sp.]